MTVCPRVSPTLNLEFVFENMNFSTFLFLKTQNKQIPIRRPVQPLLLKIVFVLHPKKGHWENAHEGFFTVTALRKST